MVSTTALTVWVYDSAMGVAAAEVRLKDLEQRGAVTVVDAMTVTWHRGADEPDLGHIRHRRGSAVAKGSVLGALVGTLVLSPAVGAAAGAGIAAGRLHGTGIDAEFVAELKTRLTPGTSALLVLSDDVDVDSLRPFIERGLARGDVSLMHAQLSEHAPEELRSLLDEAAPGARGRSPEPGEGGGGLRS